MSDNPDVASGPDAVTRAVLRGLYEGRHPPGGRLAETELAESCGVPRSAAREGLRRLEQDGIVEVVPYRGAQIRQITAREALDALSLGELLLGLAARLAAERIGEGDARGQIVEAWSGLQKVEGDVDGYAGIEARDRFHLALARAAGNREMMRILPFLQMHLVRHGWADGNGAALDGYRGIVRAVLSGDPEAAERAGRAHAAGLRARLNNSV